MIRNQVVLGGAPEWRRANPTLAAAVRLQLRLKRFFEFDQEVFDNWHRDVYHGANLFTDCNLGLTNDLFLVRFPRVLGLVLVLGPGQLPILMPALNFELGVGQHGLHLAEDRLELVNELGFVLTALFLGLLHQLLAVVDRALGRLLQPAELLLETLEVLVVGVALVVLSLAALVDLEVELVDSLDLLEGDLSLHLEHGQLLLEVVDLQLLLVDDKVVLGLLARKVQEEGQRHLLLCIVIQGWLGRRSETRRYSALHHAS